MAKIDAEAFNILLDLTNQGQIIQIDKKLDYWYEITIWPKAGEKYHKHYQGKTLIEAVMKIINP